MRALIISDTHGSLEGLKMLLANEESFDLLIHCGDIDRDAAKLRGMVGCPCRIVRGNCDYFGDQLPDEEHFSFGSYPVLLTHGHRYGVSYGLDRIYYKALEDDVKVVCYGHTHVPVCEYFGDVLVINPGSLSLPRTPDRKRSYAVMSIDDSGVLQAEIKKL